MRQHPRRSRRTEIHRGLRGKVRVHAGRELEGQRVLHVQLQERGQETDTFEEGSHLKEYTFKITGGTGQYQGASGGGTYTNEELTDTLLGGKYKGQLVLP